VLIKDERLAAQIYNKGKTGTPKEKGYLLLKPEEAVYSDYRKDIELKKEHKRKFAENNDRNIIYHDLKERGLIVKTDELGLRVYDRGTDVKGQASALVMPKAYNKIIDFNDIFTDIDRELERRTQIGIIDAENDVVYYVIDKIEWPETKLKDGVKQTINDESVKELIDKGYQVNSGLKFGTHYRVYDYESKHAPWLIHVVEEGVSWLDITRMVRVGHGVNKKIVLLYNKRWVCLDWIKP